MNTPSTSSRSVNGNGFIYNSGTGSYASSVVDDAPSTSLNGYAHTLQPLPPSPQLHDQTIVDHLYQSGFQNGHYADTILHVHQNMYRLHAIILSRSPYLAHLMSTSPQGNAPRTIYINLENEPEVTEDGIAIALGYLYSSVSLSLIRPENARAVLAAGCLLGGVEELCQLSYDMCRHSINVDTLPSWIEFTSSLSDHAPSVFGTYAHKLKETVFDHLVRSLPAEVNRNVLVDVFTAVPFEMFKAAIESPSFQIGSDQTRFKFAKDCIEKRKGGKGSGGEETVVLAFGGGSGSAVHVTRKAKGKRTLFKVSS